MTDATQTEPNQTSAATANAVQTAHDKQHKPLFSEPVVDMLGAVGSIAAGGVTA